MYSFSSLLKSLGLSCYRIIARWQVGASYGPDFTYHCPLIGALFRDENGALPVTRSTVLVLQLTRTANTIRQPSAKSHLVYTKLEGKATAYPKSQIGSISVWGRLVSRLPHLIESATHRCPNREQPLDARTTLAHASSGEPFAEAFAATLDHTAAHGKAILAELAP